MVKARTVDKGKSQNGWWLSIVYNVNVRLAGRVCDQDEVIGERIGQGQVSWEVKVQSRCFWKYMDEISMTGKSKDRTHIHTYACTHAHTHMHTYLHIHINQCMQVRTDTHTHTPLIGDHFIPCDEPKQYGMIDKLLWNMVSVKIGTLRWSLDHIYGPACKTLHLSPSSCRQYSQASFDFSTTDEIPPKITCPEDQVQYTTKDKLMIQFAQPLVRPLLLFWLLYWKYQVCSCSSHHGGCCVVWTVIMYCVIVRNTPLQQETNITSITLTQCHSQSHL